MKKFISTTALLLTFLSIVWSQVYIPPFSQGHVLPAKYYFFNQDCSKAMTVSLSEAIVWDVATGKPVQKANFTSSIREYNPFDERWSMNAVPAPDLSLVIIDLTPKGGSKQGFVFDMKTGKLSVDDGMFNDKIYGFTTKNDYVSMGNMRTPGKNPNQYLQTYIPPEGSKTPVSIYGIKNFAPVGFSLDGKIFYGKNSDNDRFIIYDPLTGKWDNTNLKYDSKTQYYFYYRNDLLYTSKWTRMPPTGDGWEDAFYNIKSKKVEKFVTKNGYTGPYTFSDDGKYGVYYYSDESKKTYQVRIKDMENDKDAFSLNIPYGKAAFNSSRMPASNKNYFYMNNFNSIIIFDLAKPEPLRSFSIMADETTIAMAKGATNSVDGITQIEEEAKSDYDLKNFLVNFPPTDHFYFNLTNAHNLKGRDILNLPFVKANYINALGPNFKVKDILALGKIGTCGDGSLLLFVVRGDFNNEDRSVFFAEHLDAKGKSIEFQQVGLMSKRPNGGPFLSTIDLGVYVANDKTAIVLEQRYTNTPKSNFKKTFMYDHGVCKMYLKQ